MRLRYSNYNDYTAHTRKNFDSEQDFLQFKQTCVDCAKRVNNEVFNYQKANDSIRNKILEIAGLPENPTAKQVRNALSYQHINRAIMELVEETINDTLVSGWDKSPLFKKYVELKTEALGQKPIFYTKKTAVVSVSKIADGHHSLERQKLGGGRQFTISVESWGAKVYMEMSRFLQGVEDWGELIDAIAEAFTRKINGLLHDAFLSAGKTLPVPEKWNHKGLLIPANHDEFVRLISDVETATGSSVTIIGTRVALAQLKNLGAIEWISNEAKSDVYNTGRLGNFEGTPLLELPQAFEKDDVNTYLEDDSKILIMPNNIDKFIKMYYEGTDETKEVSEKGENADDTKEYEFKTRFGIATLTNVRFGTWLISD